MDTVQEAVEIWFPVERDSDDYPQSQDWEQLWSWRTDYGYRIDSIPFFAKGVARGDIVLANKTDQDWLCFDKVATPSGHSTFRIWLTDEISGRADEILQELRNLGCRAEITLGQLIAVDADPMAEERAWDYLKDGSDKGHWDLQVGCSPNEQL